jgi:hypothetical protein
MLSKTIHQPRHVGVLGRNAVSNRPCYTDNLLQHPDISVIFILARLDLSRFHTKRCLEIYALVSFEWYKRVSIST